MTSLSGAGLKPCSVSPEAHEDDPERAVRAAFRAISPGAHGPKAGAAALRIGVETGPAVVGPVAAGPTFYYPAVGAVVSAAAALQSVARPALC